MIRSIELRHFRCYKSLELEKCARLNVIVGENGSGKTTLLEGIFLALAAGPEVAMRLRQQRGFDGTFGGIPRRIEEAVWGDYFYNRDFSEPVILKMSGDGPESRSLEISRGAGEAVLPLVSEAGSLDTTRNAPVSFTWTDANGVRRSVTPKFSQAGISLPDTGEDLPDFYFCPATNLIGSAENAARFSELSKMNRHQEFIKSFTMEYPWITDINVEINAGSPVLFASLKDNLQKIPLPAISMGVNRTITFLLTLAVRPHSIVLVDEIENGVYYSHLEAMWKVTLSFLNKMKGQMFVSTHSKECLQALANAAEGNEDTISIWRTETDGSKRYVHQFSGRAFRDGIQYGQEVR